MTKEQIQQLQQRLAYALKQADEAKEAAVTAEAAYDREFDKIVAEFDAAHPELVQARDKAQKAHIEANEAAKAIRDEAKDMLAEYFPQPDAETKPAVGFSMRLEKEAFYVPELLLEEAVEKQATFLLQLDEKAVQKFVTANAEKFGEAYDWPAYLKGWLTQLHIRTVHKPLISDKELIQAAPASLPEKAPF